MNRSGEWRATSGGKEVRHVSLVLLFGLVVMPLSARAGTVRGTVKNGTTGQLAAGVELTLVAPLGGMQEVAHAKSSAQGEFTFDHPNLGTQPMLVRATYHGIHFNTMAPPGTSTLQVDIFEASNDPKTIDVPSHFVVFQPNGDILKVAEEYQIENKSQPPYAYFRTDGSFDFALPEKGELQGVQAAGPSGMPLTQLPIDKKNNHYSIAFAFRPGDSTVRYSYELPYLNNAAAVKIPTVYPGGRVVFVVPPGLQVSGAGLSAAGQEQGMNLFLRQDVPPGALVAVNVSGTASGNASAGVERAPQGREAQEAGAESGGPSIQAVPGRLGDWKMLLGLSGVLAIFFAGFAYLLSRKQVAAVGGAEVPGTAIPDGKAKRPKRQAPVAGQSGPNGAATMSDVDAAIGTSLDALKESLFRLELRHQAGTITEEEYSRERAKAEKVLRELVRG
ncbi:MAG TPA: carboxypeptidase-like regulatory domain-containing protein [Candidatus Acidoferrum sp.]|nr:carboxypeptidase-like regulatory domain-containing protein [Candidatus Acidoferrum sp.]